MITGGNMAFDPLAASMRTDAADLAVSSMNKKR